MIFYTKDERETIQIGKLIGKYLRKGDIVALIGDFGSGKTTMIKGIVSYFSDINAISPSFVIINEYPGKIPLYHLDLYRINDFKELIDLGWYEMKENGIILIEWAEKIKKNLPENVIYVKIEIIDQNKRKIRVDNLNFKRRGKNDK